MSKGIFAVLHKIEAIDRLMTPQWQKTIIEVYPDVSVNVLVGQAMAHPKATGEGRASGWLPCGASFRTSTDTWTTRLLPSSGFPLADRAPSSMPLSLPGAPAGG